MKKTRTRLWSLLLTVAMLLTLLPTTALAVDTLTINGKTFEPVSQNRLSTYLVPVVEEKITDGYVGYTVISKEDTDEWDQESGEGSVQSYTYVGLYVEIPDGAFSLKMNDEGNPDAMKEVGKDFLQNGKFQHWFPIADKKGDEYVLFYGGREYTLLLDWYDAKGNVIKSEYVKVTRDLSNPAAQVGNLYL